MHGSLNDMGKQNSSTIDSHVRLVNALQKPCSINSCKSKEKKLLTASYGG